MAQRSPVDVLVVGSGLMGAAVARCVRDADPRTTVTMVDGGPRIGSQVGEHLHDVTEPEIWRRYNRAVSSGVQGFYTGTTPTAHVGRSMAGVAPGMYHLDSLGQDVDAFPSAAVAWNVGGMGVHWTAATPTPWGEEVNPCVPPEVWAADLAHATTLLRVNPEPYPVTPAGARVAGVLDDVLGPASAPGRGVQPMPMAVQEDGAGFRTRTGPNKIFPALADPDLDPAFTLLAGTLAVEVLGRAPSSSAPGGSAPGEATGVRVRDVATGEERVLQARAVVLCADAVRTPQLLFASGVRPPALGRYLNEHAFLTSQVLADPDRLGFDLDALPLPTQTEWAVDALWVPQSRPAQPFQFQVMNNVAFDDDRRPIAYAVGLEVYVPTEVRAENRLEFSTTATDVAGLPRITAHFGYTDADRALIEEGRRVQRQVAERIGPFDPATESAVLAPGSSLHLTGTVRMGTRDDGTSVCDPDGRVWGWSNLLVAGTGVLPTALSCNATLAGMTTAVRAAGTLTRLLS